MRNYAVRLSVDGAEVVDATLRKVGATGQQSMERIGTASQSLQQQIDRSFGTASSSFRDRAVDIDAYGAELDNLRAKFNPLFAASKQYETQLAEISRAERLGAISAHEAAAARQVAAASLMPTTTAAVGYGRAMQASTAHTANLTAQLNDIGVMLAAGQSPLQLALQQGTQVNQVFAQLGGGGAALRAMGSAFIGMINPLSLATIGIIGFGAAGVQWLMSLGEEAVSLEDRFEDLADATGDVRDAVDLLATSQIDLREEFAGSVEQVNLLRQAIGQLALDQINEKIGAMAPEAFASLAEGIAKIDGAAEDMRRRMADMGRDFEGFSIEHIAAQLGTTAEFAEIATTAIDQMNAATSSDERNRALLETLEQLDAMRDAAGRLPPEARALHDALVPIAAEISRSVALSGQLEDGMSGATGAIEAAGAAATRVADEIARAAGNAMSLAAQAASALAESQIRLDNRGNPVGEAGAMAAHRYDDRVGDISGADPILRDELMRQRDAYIANEEAVARNRAALAEWNAEQRKAAGGGGGRGGASGTDKAARELEREAEARQRVIDGLRFEVEQIGQSDVARRIAQETRRAGVDLYSLEGQQIADLVERAHELQSELDRLTEVNDYAARTFSDLFTGAIGGADSFKEALGGVLAELGKMAVSNAFIAMISGSGFGGSGAGNLLSTVFGIGAPGFATGGSFTVGGSGGTDSQLITFRATPGEMVDVRRPGQSGGRAVSLNFAPVINAQGADATALARVQSQLATMEQRFGEMVQGSLQDPRYRGAL